MNGDVVRKVRVLITVMTYPHPSAKHQELVCTAGITDTLEWVRLYPIDYRYRPQDQQFHKYQWVEVEVGPLGHGNDHRRESRRPDLASLRVQGLPLGTADGWQARRQVIDAMPHHTMGQLEALFERDQTSLGILRPRRVLDVTIKPDTDDWKPEWQALFQQLTLFGPPQKPLMKLPFKWSYVFECEDNPKPYTRMIEDWELGVLFLKLRDEMDERAAADKVREKYLNQLCAVDRDTRFFMGTVFPCNTWIVLGVFWPPKVHQLGLL